MFKRFFFTSILIFGMVHLSTEEVYSQEKEGEIIIISEKVGEVIDLEERNLYGLYPGIEGFQSAVVLKLSDGSYVFEITCIDDSTGEKKVVSYPQDESKIKKIGKYIDNFEKTVQEEDEPEEPKAAKLKPPKHSRGKSTFGVNGGIVIPTGEFGEVQKNGYQLGFICRIPTNNPTVMVSMGAGYTIMKGKTVEERGSYTYQSGHTTVHVTYHYTIIYETFKPFSIFIGPQFGKENKAYFLPAVTGNFEEDWTRFGIDIGAGVLLPINNSHAKIDLSAKFCLMNMVGKEDKEKSVNVIRLLAGIVF